MSTDDAPGAIRANRDKMAMGCWAEHEDGSLIFVESTESSRIVYSIFDTKEQIEYRDAMPVGDFEKQFSWNVTGAKRDIKWTWHDKTPFPWERVMEEGARPGPRFASAERMMSAAAKVARSLGLRGKPIERDTPAGLDGKTTKEKAQALIKQMQEFLDGLRE